MVMALILTPLECPPAIKSGPLPMTPPSEIDPTDPWLREAQTFPELSPEMMRRVAAYGEEEEFGEDKLLFERGQRSIDFFLLIDGEIEIFATNARSGRTVLYTYKPGQFSGELNLFNSRQVLLSGLARAGTRVVRVVNADFRKLISGEPDIGEIIMRAFILRRVGFIRHSQGGVLLAGHRHGADFMRLQRFMTRNGYPLEIVDVDVEEDAADFLRRFALGAADRDCLAIWGQAAMASSEAGSTIWNSCPKLYPNLPLKPAQRTWSRRSAPLRDQRICCDLFIRRLTRKLAVPSVSDVPTGRPARWRSA
jgi:CRP-like cAMP-binding protein